MKTICVGLSAWNSVGGAPLFFRRLFKALPEYQWIEVSPNQSYTADLLIYGNLHSFYEQAQCPCILRTQGARSLSMPQPTDLKAVVCSSRLAYERSTHPARVLIYNGVDKAHLDDLQPIQCDYLCGDGRVGQGQRTINAIRYTNDLTVLGDGSGVSNDDTYQRLKKTYPHINFAGLVDEDTSYRYVKGCKGLLITNPSHGVSNMGLVAKYFNKPIINLSGGPVETPDPPDIKECAEQYRALIESII